MENKRYPASLHKVLMNYTVLLFVSHLELAKARKQNVIIPRKSIFERLGKADHRGFRGVAAMV